MPVLTLQTNVPDSEISDEVIKQLSGKVSEILAVPEDYVAIQVTAGQRLFFAGSNDRAALLDLVAITLNTEETKRYSEAIMTVLEESLKIKANRVYLRFHAFAPHMIGWNKTLLFLQMIIRCLRRSASTSTAKKPVDDYTHCVNLVRQNDYENFICTGLLRPSSLQRPAMAIRALNVELSSIRDQVSKSQIGQMRLQFWKETVESIYASVKSETPRKINHPVAREIDLLVRFNQPSKLWFQRLIKSRETTLNDMPFADLDQLENYLEQSITPSYYLLLELAKQRSLNTDHIASHLGRAQGLVNTVRGIPYNARQRRCLIPQSYLVEHQLSQQDLFNMQFSSEQCRQVVHQLCRRSYDHLGKTLVLFEKETNVSRSLFLPLIVVSDYLKRIKAVDFDLNHKSLQERNPWLVWNLWRQKYPRSNDLLSF